ncbi:MAG: sulfur carrier protein ThiS [Planctomycetota bacterium]
MKVQLNGAVHDLPSESTVRDLLRTLGREGVPCAVEVNLKLVPHREHAAHALKDGDRVEVVTLVGGG